MYMNALQFWGDEYPDLLQALMQTQGQAPNPNGVEAGAGPSTSGLGNSLPSHSGHIGSGGLPEWLTNPSLPPGMSSGTQAGLGIAENADWIGRGVGALTGLPGMSMLANALANQYMNSHVFQSPFDGQSSLDDSIDEYLYGAVPGQSPADLGAPSQIGPSFHSSMAPGQYGSRLRARTGGSNAGQSSGVDKKRKK